MATVQEEVMCVLWFFETKSVIKMQRRYSTQHGKDNTIRRWLKQFQEPGSVLHRKGARRPSSAQEAFSRSLQKSTTVWMAVHNRLQIIKLSALHFHIP
jgi:transposase-like protein